MAGIKNVSEWAKKQACWESLRTQKVIYGSGTERYLIASEDVKAADRESRRDAVVVSGIEAQTRVVSEGAEFWTRLRDWGSTKRTLSTKEDGILKTCAMIPARIPSEKQCIAALDILEKAHSEGYRNETHVSKVKLHDWGRQH